MISIGGIRVQIAITRLALRIFAELKVIVRTGFLEAKGCLGLRVLSAGDAFAVGS